MGGAVPLSLRAVRDDIEKEDDQVTTPFTIHPLTIIPKLPPYPPALNLYRCIHSSLNNHIS